VQLLKRTMPFLIGGLFGALITFALLVILMERDSLSGSGNEQATGAHHHGESHAGHASNQAEIGPVVDLTKQSKVEIDIKDYAYSRPNIKVSKGTAVIWTNQDAIPHNVMEEHAESGEAHQPPAADQVRDDVFAGPLLGHGESYSFTFNKAGTYLYHCAPHPSIRAVVLVTE
jgi:amicyanin